MEEDCVNLDLTTEEGRENTKAFIKGSLINFDHKDKVFIGNLLYIMLNTISEQQIKIETMEDIIGEHQEILRNINSK